VIKKAWDTLFDSNDHLLFCSRNTSVDLSLLHPSQVHIFKLWQIYLENVNPLLKITHTPSLQGRIIDAAGDVTNIKPSLEALMFSIYCAAVFSMAQAECYKLFGAKREDILAGYQLGAREALLNSGFLKSSDRDCLTAIHIYLVSCRLRSFREEFRALNKAAWCIQRVLYSSIQTLKISSLQWLNL
jgi:hypothetical protein